MGKPNIFDISSKELSQDAFITWLLLWADCKNSEKDKSLNLCGIEFISELMRKELVEFSDNILNVKAGRQWLNIDVWAEVNDKYLIIIEHKTFSGQHSDQLLRYRAIAEIWCSEQTPQYAPPICIYLKTGNESLQSLNHIIKQGYKIYNRLDFISLLKRHNISNDIFNDYKERLIRIEELNHEWENKVVGNWQEYDWQGFFQYLEKEINIIGWDFANNPNGGVWYAVLNWNYWKEYPIYLQIEQDKLCFKISTDPEVVELPVDVTREEIRDSFLEHILNEAMNKNFYTIKRPYRLGRGNSMTVAIVNCEDWLGNPNDLISKDNVVERLRYYKDFLLNAITSIKF